MFIAIEGIDGAGKSTALPAIRHFLESRGYAVAVTAEPTKQETGRLLRELLGRAEESTYRRHELALLFAADRLRHLETEVEPLLAEGKIVATDRYLFSSLAYQSADLPYEWVREINRFAPLPDIVLFIDVSVETALERIAQNRASREMFETREFLSRIVATYQRVLHEYAGQTTVLRLDGELPIEKIPGNVETVLGPFFPRNG